MRYGSVSIRIKLFLNNPQILKSQGLLFLAERMHVVLKEIVQKPRHQCGNGQIVITMFHLTYLEIHIDPPNIVFQ